MKNKTTLKQAIAIADICKILSVAFNYPNEELSNGLSDGTLMQDMCSCLQDLDFSDSDINQLINEFKIWQHKQTDTLLTKMKQVYTNLYLKPGGYTPIFPFESAFLHVEKGFEGIPSLFRTPVTLDVEKQMEEAGVKYFNSRKEPSDYIFCELEFLSFLYANFADALYQDLDETGIWNNRIQNFQNDHIFVWVPNFMQKTKKLALNTPYVAFATLGCIFIDKL